MKTTNAQTPPNCSASPVAPVEVDYLPPSRYEGTPFEVLRRSDVLRRTDLAVRQRSGFHQLILCTSGRGSHNVDFEPLECQTGTLIRIHPGQVQRFTPDPSFEALMVVWPDESHRTAPGASPWYPGSNIATTWQLETERFDRIRRWVAELDEAQQSYDRSPLRQALLQSLLTTMLLRLELELAETHAHPAVLPEAYLAYRKAIEEQLYDRPSINSLAASIGYSTRTLDRACNDVSGQTARQVLDDRVVLELRRLLTNTDRSLNQIAADFRFYDASNFSKFVKRHTGMTPAVLRRAS